MGFFQIFSKFGKVLKMIIFTKNSEFLTCLSVVIYLRFVEVVTENLTERVTMVTICLTDSFQALIQMSDPVAANAAKLVSREKFYIKSFCVE